jgi:phosphoenolpyruvate---glycerone phosphotransferase subunit DhaK
MPMKKFINAPENLTAELLEGFALAHRHKIALQGKTVLRAAPKSADKVALVTLGGAGHEPALSGFVGPGMLDASVVGDIFAAPGAPAVLAALQATARPAGTLLVILNHAGDVMAGDMAFDMATQQGVNVQKILTHEDISAGRDAPLEHRRGLVGCIPLYKIAGAAAEAGRSLEEVRAIAERFSENLRTLAVALTPATHPASGGAIGEIADDEMEVGMGQHGEGGGGVMKMATADQTAQIMLDKLLDTMTVQPGDKLLVMINGSGATTLMEQYIVLRAVNQLLAAKGLVMARSLVGEFLTVQEMGGFQMCIAKLDDELIELFDAPCDTPSWTVK